MGVGSKFINVRCAKGFIDRTPAFMIERQKIMDKIEIIYKRHASEKLETPVFELKELFSNKRNVCNKLLDLDDQGGEILAMRYDLKHPLTRYLAMNKIEKHLKISQSGYVYRNDKMEPDNFRLKEFFVSDFDICGPTDAMVSEVQCLRMCCDIMRLLELEEPVRIVVGHKKITEALLRTVANISDSQAVKIVGRIAGDDDTVRSRIDWATVAMRTRSEKVMTETTISALHDSLAELKGPMDHVLDKIASNERLVSLKESKSIINDLMELRQFCRAFLSEHDYGRIEFDFSLIGSRSFYTGLVFACQLDSNGMVLMSGGRYDNLISRINPKSKDKIGCTGFSFGVDQLVMYRMAKSGLSPLEIWGQQTPPGAMESNFANGCEVGDGNVTPITAMVGEQGEQRAPPPSSSRIEGGTAKAPKQNQSKVNNNNNNGVGGGVEENVLKNVKGTMDRNPQMMMVRERVFSTIIDCFQRHGASTIDTPVVERHDVLTGKYGEDSKLIYDLNDVDEEKLSLRYDLTVPFARYLAVHPEVLQDNSDHEGNGSIFKRYQIAKVYRRDNPSMSRGRYREFYQCDFDIAGPIIKRNEVGQGEDRSSSSMQPDFECLNVVYEILRDLGLGEFRIKVNHRRFLDGLMAVCGVPEPLFRTICSSIDKLDKTPWDKVCDEMVLQKGLPRAVAEDIGRYVALSGGLDLVDRLEADPRLSANDDVRRALLDLRRLFALSHRLMDRVRFDLSLARGLDYYTGMIFEAVFTDFESDPQSQSALTDEEPEKEEQIISVGSVSGGGRYDNLVNMFSECSSCDQSTSITIPCVGLSIGVERLMAIYDRQRQNDNKDSVNSDGREGVSSSSSSVVMVISAQKNMIAERFRLLAMLLDAGITASHSMKKNPKALDVFQECERMRIPLAVIVGEDELKEDAVKLRYIDSRREEMVPRSQIIARLRSELNLS